MIQIFLSYARSDGLDAAARLRDELTGMGFAVWRDIEEMRGGLAWRKQLFQALSKVDAVLVLLTPGAVVSANVTWEWQRAQEMDQRMIPLLINPCDVPADLKTLHYHRLDEPAGYTLGLARLTRDLIALAVQKQGDAPMAEAGDVITVFGNDNAVAARGAAIIKQSGGAPLDPAVIAQMLAALRSQPTDGLSDQQMAELRGILGDLQGQVQGVALGIDDLKTGQQHILARFDLAEQHILAPVVARLKEQEATLLDKVLDVLDVTTVGADELDRHLTVIDAALAEINAHAVQITDRQLAASAQQVAELASPLGLDVKHKLKLTLPIIPVLLSYEGEFELGSKLDLAETWRWLHSLEKRKEAEGA